MPKSRSGDERWKKLSACDCTSLREVHDAPQLGRRRRNLDREQRVARFRRSDEVAHRADAAGAAGQRGHFAERPAFAEFLESAELGDVKLRVLHFAIVIELDGDLRVALDAGYGVDENLFWTWGLCSEMGFAGEIGHPAREQFRQDKVDGVSLRRASGDEQVHLHMLMHGPGVRQHRAG